MTALDLAQQALPSVQVEEAGVPPAGHYGVLPGLLINGEPDPAPAVLIDPQVRYQGRLLIGQGIGVRGERRLHHRP